MKNIKIEINWPNGNKMAAEVGSDWLLAAKKAGVEIPTGCLSGSCGACEIDVNGETIRACINTIEANKKRVLNVELINDPYW